MGPLSYEIETEKGVWRRHINQVYGKEPKAGNSDCEMDLDVSYELDETTVVQFIPRPTACYICSRTFIPVGLAYSDIM